MRAGHEPCGIRQLGMGVQLNKQILSWISAQSSFNWCLCSARTAQWSMEPLLIVLPDSADSVHSKVKDLISWNLLTETICINLGEGEVSTPCKTSLLLPTKEQFGS